MIPSFKYKFVTKALTHLTLGKMLESEESNNPVFNYGQLFAGVKWRLQKFKRSWYTNYIVNLKSSTHCSLKQTIRLVKYDECEFVARNKEKLKSHTRKPHDVK